MFERTIVRSSQGTNSRLESRGNLVSNPKKDAVKVYQWLVDNLDNETYGRLVRIMFSDVAITNHPQDGSSSELGL